MHPIHSDTLRHSPCKTQLAPLCTSNPHTPVDNNKDLEPKDLIQKLSQIVDLLAEDMRQSCEVGETIPNNANSDSMQQA